MISLINGFQVFDQVWVMTEGGPAGASTVVVEQIVRNTFSYGRAGYASAQSVVLFVIILAVTAVQLRLQKRWVFYVMVRTARAAGTLLRLRAGADRCAPPR